MIPPRSTAPLLPRSLPNQLDLSAEKLFLGSYEDYREVCSFLGLAIKFPEGPEEHGPDGFVTRNAQGVAAIGGSPVPFL